MNLLRFPDGNSLDEAAANLIVGLLQTNPRAVLGLATGSTPVGMYRKLVEAYESGVVSFKQAVTFNLDEYIGLSPDHEQSYHHYMRTHLFDRVDLPAEQGHLPSGVAADPEAECRRYDELIERHRYPDLQVLGIGHNGHIGFNEPADGLTSGTHVVKLHEHTRKANARFFASPDEVPTHAITMGIGTILKAKTILLLVKGADKADIVARALTGPITTQCPASLLQTHPNLVVMVDSEAGRNLQ